MNAMKVIAGLVGLLLVLPIWYYLLYQVLVRVQASELMWFLYWIYLPAGVLVQGIGKVVEVYGKKD